MMPGHMVLTRMPSRPSSCAIAHVNAWIAAFDARVRRGARGHHLPADRRDVDDAAAVALLDEAATERAAHVEGAVQVDVDDAVPQLGIEVDDRHTVGAASGTGVVDDDVDASELVDHLLRERVDRGDVRDVAHHASARRPSARTSSATDSMSRQPASFSSSG